MMRGGLGVKKKLQGIFIVMCFCVLSSFSGCSNEEATTWEDSKDTIYKIGNTEVNYSEVWIYTNTVKQGYESIYGTGIWNIEVGTDDNKQTIEEVTREDIIDTITRTKILVDKAPEYEITLSGEEKEKVNQQAKEFFDHLTDEDISECGASIELAIKVFEENAIADKVYAKILKDNTYEVSEEDARMTTVYDLIFETYSLDGDGNPVPFSDEAAKTRLDDANAAFERLVTEENVVIEDIVSQYSLKYAGEHTLSYDDMEQEYGEKACSVIYSLEDGECSQVIKTDYGYHIIKMIASTDEKATDENRKKLNKVNEKKYFNEIYDKWKKDAMGSFDYDKDINQEVYNRITF